MSQNGIKTIHQIRQKSIKNHLKTCSKLNRLNLSSNMCTWMRGIRLGSIWAQIGPNRTKRTRAGRNRLEPSKQTRAISPARARRRARGRRRRSRPPQLAASVSVASSRGEESNGGSSAGPPPPASAADVREETADRRSTPRRGRPRRPELKGYFIYH